MKRVLITGANRGIGLELARQLLARGERVFASCRQPEAADALLAMQATYPDTLSIPALDVADDASIDAAFDLVSAHTRALDWLFNNAGVNHGSKGMGDSRHHNALGHLRADVLMRVWRVNALGPLMVTQRFLPLLRAGQEARVVNISSGMGSIANRASGGSYAYTSSKAALNMLTRSLAFDLRRAGIVVVTVNPGWVKTDMGGSGAPVPVEESARGLIRLTDGLTLNDTGRFLHWHGGEEAW